MEVYAFLKGLPAVLGVTGFFAYLWAGQSRIGGELLKEIVNKLRANPNINVDLYDRITPAKLNRLVEADERVRRTVNKDDQKLLRLLIILQYVFTSIVLVVCALLVGLSIWLYMRPEPLSLTQTGPEPVAKEAEGLLVDLDPIRIQWTSKGKAENVSVFLENVDSQRRSGKKTVSSGVRSVVFDSNEVLSVASDRSYHGKNRIRSVIEWVSGHSISEARDVFVGIQVELRLNGRLITPDGKERTIHTLFATIDRSTERIPPDYSFRGDFAGMTTNGPIVVPLKSDNNHGEIDLPWLHRVDWTRNVGFVYGGPDDSRIVRTQVLR